MAEALSSYCGIGEVARLTGQRGARGEGRVGLFGFPSSTDCISGFPSLSYAWVSMCLINFYLLCIVKECQYNGVICECS